MTQFNWNYHIWNHNSKSIPANGKAAKNWNEWQLELHQVQEKQQQLTEQRHQATAKDEQVREQLEQKRLAWQAAKSDREHYLEQLKELNAEALSDLTIEIKDHQQNWKKHSNN